MAITRNEFNKIWGSTSSVPTYTFSDGDYQDGWEFVDNLPPTRAMWDTLQRRNDQKAKYLLDTIADQAVSVKEYGAVGDGVTDDTVAIQSANDAGQPIFFPAGSYAVTNLTQSVAWHMGDGAELLYTGTENNGVCVECSVNNLVNGDIVINGNGKQIYRALLVSGNNNTYKRVKIHNITATSQLATALYVIGNTNKFYFCEFSDLVNTGYNNDSVPQGATLSGSANGNVFDCIVGQNTRSNVVNNAGAGTTNYFGNIYSFNCNDNGLYCVAEGNTVCDAVFYDGADNAVGFRHGCNASIGDIYVARAGASNVFFGDCGDINIGSIYVANSPDVILHTNQADTGDIKIGAIKGSVSAMVFALFRNADNPNIVKSLSIDTIDLVANWDSTLTLTTCMDFTAVDEIHINTLRLKAICDNTPFSIYKIAFNNTLLRKSDVGYVDINFYQSDGVTVDTAKTYQYVNGTQALLSYSYSLLPLSGGTLTGQVNVSNGKAIHFVDSSQVTGGYIGAVGTGLRLTAGGFGLSQSGARIELRDRSYATDPGMFEIIASDANNTTSLIGKPSGVLRWGNNDILTSAGGTMTTADVLKRNADTAYLRIMGGTGYTTGASITLMGQDRGTQPGEFVIRAKSSSSYKDLNGKPDGTLLWDGQPIQTSSDKRLKQGFSDVPASVLEAWSKVEWKRFKYKSDADKKGAKNCRWHTGLVAQDVQKVGEESNVDLLKYGILCHDVQEATEEREAVDLWTVRYEEALAMEAIYLRNEIKKLRDEIKVLKEKYHG